MIQKAFSSRQNKLSKIKHASFLAAGCQKINTRALHNRLFE